MQDEGLMARGEVKYHPVQLRTGKYLEDICLPIGELLGEWNKPQLCPIPSHFKVTNQVN